MRTKFRSASMGAFMLGSVFLAGNATAQDTDVSDKISGPETRQDEPVIRMTLPNLTNHPLAGGIVLQRLCATDGLDEKKCDDVEVFIEPPALENPLGQVIHAFRRELAVDDLDAAPRVADDLQTFINERGGEFDNPQSLTRLIEIQQDLDQGIKAQDLDILDQVVQDFWTLIVQLEEDMLSEAEKALRDAQEALKKALEEGVSEEELKELREQAEQAMQDFMEEQLQKAEENQLSPEDKAALEDMQKMMEELQKMMAAWRDRIGAPVPTRRNPRFDAKAEAEAIRQRTAK